MLDNRMSTWIQMSVPNKEFIEILLESKVYFEIITARPVEHNKDTQEWLDRNVKPGLIINNSKTKYELMNRGDVLIDDCPGNIKKVLDNNRIGKLYTDNGNAYEDETKELNLGEHHLGDYGFRELLKTHRNSLLEEIKYINSLNPSKRIDSVILMKLMEEAVDVALCALSIALYNTDIKTVEKLLSTKMDKWQSRYTKSID